MVGKRLLSDPSSQINSLDGLRGIAVLIVFFSHTANRGWHLIPGLNFQGIGKSGVYLFFLLSAFLLSRNLCRSPERFFDLKKTKSYWSRRFLRVYPIYILYLGLSLIVFYFLSPSIPMEPSMNLERVFRHLLLQEGLFVTWSIPVEFKYYVILPFITWIVLRALEKNGLMAFFVLSFMIAMAVYFYPVDNYMKNDIRTGPYLVIFLIGSYIGVLDAKKAMPLSILRKLSPFLIISALIGLLCATPSFYGWLNNELPQRKLSNTWFAYFAIVWSAVLMVCLYGYDWIVRRFEFVPLQYTGQVSFSFYLWHPTVLALTHICFSDLNGTLKAWLALFGTVVFSSLTYQLVERPFSRIGTNISRELP